MVDVLGVIPSVVLGIGFQFLTKQRAVNVPKNRVENLNNTEKVTRRM